MEVNGILFMMLTAVKKCIFCMFLLLWIIYSPHCEHFQLLSLKDLVLMKTFDSVFCGLSGVTRPEAMKHTEVILQCFALAHI